MTETSDRPIADYAMLSDVTTSALVSRLGSVDWLCLPRFDAPSVFARLLDGDAGHWSIAPSGAHEAERRYLPGTLVLETTFTTPSGACTVTDALALGPDERGHDIGADAPHALLRVVEVTAGEVALDVDLAPRFEYGLVAPRLLGVEGGVRAEGGATRLVVSGPPPTATDAATALWRLGPTAGDRVAFALQWSDAGASAPRCWTPEEIEARLASTIEGWRSWSALHQRYEGPWAEEVHHSGRILQGLSHHATGAIVAAPTTSLPEAVGGGRNWDYRYTWVRDASLTLQALWVAACPDEATRFVEFLLRSTGADGRGRAALQVMYGIGGEHDLSERELDHLSGWRGSRPVRVGNDAWRQEQHDIYGALLDAVLCFREQLDGIDPRTATFLGDLADAAAEVWSEPDRGIWEVRGEPQHFLHSKLMCWVALDRASRLADDLGLSRRARPWVGGAAAIRRAILDQGWNEEVGAFTQAFGSDRLDASCLLLAITGFLPADDPRMRSTIERVADGLAAPGGLLYRYLGEDGLEGEEAPFLLCSFWLAECWARCGELERAQEVFGGTLRYANDVGLLAEEADPATGELLGNHPQAFSHIGLVNAAQAIAVARADRDAAVGR